MNGRLQKHFLRLLIVVSAALFLSMTGQIALTVRASETAVLSIETGLSENAGAAAETAERKPVTFFEVLTALFVVFLVFVWMNVFFRVRRYL